MTKEINCFFGSVDREKRQSEYRRRHGELWREEMCRRKRSVNIIIRFNSRQIENISMRRNMDYRVEMQFSKYETNDQ